MIVLHLKSFIGGCWGYVMNKVVLHQYPKHTTCVNCDTKFELNDDTFSHGVSSCAGGDEYCSCGGYVGVFVCPKCGEEFEDED